MKTLRNLVLVGLTLIGITSFVPVVSAADPAAPASPGESLQGEAEEAIRDAGADGGASLSDVITDIVNALIFVVGSISVIMVVVGGIRYTLSGGEASATQGAKDTILYALIGVGVALFAYTMVNFVINRL